MTTFFVTGANSGIGRALVEAYPAARVQWVPLDVSDLTSVRRAAEAFLASGRPLDVLVNNAGIAGTRALSQDGFDVTYATKHIGPFLLTNLLLPRVRESRQGRVVNVASAARRRGAAGSRITP
ncbi:MAG TPA: SDR family NAD(P)-dependent oxidoreductase [Gemmatimonadales bacterium]|jgi:dehydrogenase/reductase SDR family protein 13|nr:SDR family NAD(P)-dependent oxidoreductase [Gemmatimonadales bacterium]